MRGSSELSNVLAHPSRRRWHAGALAADTCVDEQLAARSAPRIEAPVDHIAVVAVGGPFESRVARPGFG